MLISWLFKCVFMSWVYVWYHVCYASVSPSDWNRSGPLIWHSLNLLILHWHVSTYPETRITHQWALMPDPGWLLSLQMNKHVTTNTSVDQTSDELEMVSVYAVRESNDALGLFTDDVEKHVINQRRIAPCLLLFVETCPLQRTGNQGPRRDGSGFVWRPWGHSCSRESRGIGKCFCVCPFPLSSMLLWKHRTVFSSCLSGIRFIWCSLLLSLTQLVI